MYREKELNVEIPLPKPRRASRTAQAPRPVQAEPTVVATASNVVDPGMPKDIPKEEEKKVPWEEHTAPAPVHTVKPK